MYGGALQPHWVEVHKSRGQSGDILSTGVHHFCNDECLKNFMLTGKKRVTEKHEPKPNLLLPALRKLARSSKRKSR